MSTSPSPRRLVRAGSSAGGAAGLALWAAALAASLAPAPAAAQAVAESAIAVDFAQIRRVVPAMMFGQNLQPIERGESLLRADGTPDPDLLALLGEARITTLRYPGGTSADFFHWWQALGPQSSRPRQSTGYLGEYYAPVLGPEEFITLSVALRATPFFTANSGTGSAEEAGAAARFFASRGFPVTFWEVGNEIYFEGIGENGLVGLPPEVYARKVIRYAAAIRQEAPYAKVFAAGVIGPEEQTSFWNSVVLGLAGRYVDGVSVHNAYFPLYGTLPDRTVPSDAYLYTAMLGATRAVERSTTVLEEQLRALGKLIPIFVTEYDGVFYPDPAIEPEATTYARNSTLACALFNASVLNVFLRHERVYGAHHMALAGPRFGSLVGGDEGARFRNPQFYVHREYAREVGNLLVAATVTPRTGVFSSGPIRLLSGQTDVPMLDAVATRSPDGRRYALFVVNRSLTHAVEAPVTLGLPAGLGGTVTVLTGPRFDARNTADAPLRVAPVTAAFPSASSFTHRFAPHSLTVFRWSR